jgi:hypothetical protein
VLAVQGLLRPALLAGGRLRLVEVEVRVRYLRLC